MTENVTLLIDPAPPVGSEKQVEELFQNFEQQFGSLYTGIKLFGINPFLLELHYKRLGYFIKQHQTLRVPLLLMISMLLAKEKHCAYYLTKNENGLVNSGFDLEALRIAQEDPTQVPLDEKDKSMLLLVLKAIKTPHEVNEQDIQTVRNLGWTDLDIFDAVNHAALSMGMFVVFDTFSVNDQAFRSTEA